MQTNHNNPGFVIGMIKKDILSEKTAPFTTFMYSACDFINLWMDPLFATT